MKIKKSQKQAGLTPGYSLISDPQQISWPIFKFGDVTNISVFRRAFSVMFSPKHSHMVPSYMTGGH